MKKEIEKIIVLKNICKNYKTKNKEIAVLKNLNIDFNTGKFYAIIGDSGCGKSTLINILGLLDRPTTGEYILYGNLCDKLSDDEISDLRRDNLGLIFQDYLLNPYMTALENVMLPMLINKKIEKNERIEKAKKLLEDFGLKNRINHFPKKLSGGEQQRVAIARSMANNPQIILADEPTGNLDEKNEIIIFKLLKEMSRNGKCVIVVTHSKNVKNYADIIYKIENLTLEEVKYENN